MPMARCSTCGAVLNSDNSCPNRDRKETYYLQVNRMELDLIADGIKTITSRYDVGGSEYYTAAVAMSDNFDRLRGFEETIKENPQKEHHAQKREGFKQAYSAGRPVADNPQA